LKISMVVAMSENRVIGASNSLPWYLPEDLKKFRELTTGHAMIMGRKTFESLPKVLPGREHYVITRSENYKEENKRASESNHVFVIPDPVSAVNLVRERIAYEHDIPEEIFVIGGGEIFSQLLSYASKLYVTLLKKPIEGDTYFPEIQREDWKETGRSIFDNFDFIEYTRISTSDRSS
jgi:dihydrofolate reductase